MDSYTEYIIVDWPIKTHINQLNANVLSTHFDDDDSSYKSKPECWKWISPAILKFNAYTKDCIHGRH